jgi:hypothetical protein
MVTATDQPEPTCSATTLLRIGSWHAIKRPMTGSITLKSLALFEEPNNSPERAPLGENSPFLEPDLDTERRSTNMSIDSVIGYVSGLDVSGDTIPEPEWGRMLPTSVGCDAAGGKLQYSPAVGEPGKVTNAFGLAGTVPLTEVEIDAVSGGHGRGSAGFAGSGLTINIEPVIAIGDVFVNGNVTTGNATGNNANSSIVIAAGLFKNFRLS